MWASITELRSNISAMICREIKKKFSYSRNALLYTNRGKLSIAAKQFTLMKSKQLYLKITLYYPWMLVK